MRNIAIFTTALFFTFLSCEALASDEPITSEEFMQLKLVHGDNFVEISRKPSYSIIRLQFSDKNSDKWVQNSLRTLAICKLVEKRHFSHYITLEREFSGESIEELTIGVTSDSNANIENWSKFKGRFPAQFLFSYEDNCNGVEDLFKDEIIN